MQLRARVCFCGCVCTLCYSKVSVPVLLRSLQKCNLAAQELPLAVAAWIGYFMFLVTLSMFIYIRRKTVRFSSCYMHACTVVGRVHRTRAGYVLGCCTVSHGFLPWCIVIIVLKASIITGVFIFCAWWCLCANRLQWPWLRSTKQRPFLKAPQASWRHIRKMEDSLAFDKQRVSLFCCF